VIVSIGPVARQIGLSPAVDKKGAEPLWRANAWPPSDVGLAAGGDGEWQRETPNSAPGPIFVKSSWDPVYYAFVVLSVFVRSQSAWPSWSTILGAALPPNAPVEEGEFKELHDLIQYRPGVLGEALAQRDDIISHFRGVLSFTALTHPYTYGLCKIAETIGFFLVMHYKGVFNRPRPSRLAPQLMPPIDVPGHAAFPSGHATQSHLIALCLKEVVPVSAWKALNASGGEWLNPTTGLSMGPIFRIAERLARNREVLGLHYPSDSLAGKLLAQAAHPLIVDTLSRIKAGTNTMTPAGFDLLAAAKAEW